MKMSHGAGSGGGQKSAKNVLRIIWMSPNISAKGLSKFFWEKFVLECLIEFYVKFTCKSTILIYILLRYGLENLYPRYEVKLNHRPWGLYG
jgi:hypothetical protein